MRETNTSITEYVQSYNTFWDELIKMKPIQTSHFENTGTEASTPRGIYPLSLSSERTKTLPSFCSCGHILAIEISGMSCSTMNRTLTFINGRQPPGWFQRVVSGKIGFRKAVRVLLAYSLIEAKEDSDAFAMHPVVHEWCRNTMDVDRRQEVAFLAITTVGFAVPTRMEAKGWKLQLRLLPHASQCRQWLKSAEDKTLCQDERCDLDNATYKLGIIHSSQSKFAEAERLLQRVLDSRDRISQPELGERDLTTKACCYLNFIYLSLGKLVAAEAMLKRAQKEREVLSGPDDLDVIEMTCGLGIVYRE